MRHTEEEYVGIMRDEEMGIAHIMILHRKYGVISDRKKFEFEIIGDNSLSTFLLQYYSSLPIIPRFIYVNEDPDSKDILEASLERIAEHKVSIIKVSDSFQINEKRQLMDLLLHNLAFYIEKGHSPSVVELKRVLKLEFVPRIIDCFDISNFGTSFAVGACTRFINGNPYKPGYRKFKIKVIFGQNDYAMIEQIVYRRYSSFTTESQIPDLIVIDGGSGQLRSAINSINRLGLDIQCISLAKENEEIHTAYSNEPLILPRQNAALKLLQHIRDEAHRFALMYNVTLRKFS